MRSGLIVNNNERTEDYDVIDPNLRQGEISNFEDKSFERSTGLSSSVNESVTGSYLESFRSNLMNDSIDSEMPLEISMTTSTDNVVTNAAPADVIESNGNENKRQQDKDLVDYDIVETSTLAAKACDEVKNSDTLKDKNTGVDSEQPIKSVIMEHVVPSANEKQVPLDMVDITEDSQALFAPSVSDDSHLISTTDGSDIVDVPEHAVMSANEKQVPLDIVDVTEESQALFASGAFDKDRMISANENAGSDIVDIELPNVSVGFLEEGFVLEPSNAEKEDTEERNAVAEVGKDDDASREDLNTRSKEETAMAEGNKDEVDDEDIPLTSQAGIETSCAVEVSKDLKDDDDGFDNIDTDEIFVDARSELSDEGNQSSSGKDENSSLEGDGERFEEVQLPPDEETNASAGEQQTVAANVLSVAGNTNEEGKSKDETEEMVSGNEIGDVSIEESSVNIKTVMETQDVASSEADVTDDGPRKSEEMAADFTSVGVGSPPSMTPPVEDVTGGSSLAEEIIDQIPKHDDASDSSKCTLATDNVQSSLPERDDKDVPITEIDIPVTIIEQHDNETDGKLSDGMAATEAAAEIEEDDDKEGKENDGSAAEKVSGNETASEQDETEANDSNEKEIHANVEMIGLSESSDATDVPIDSISDVKTEDHSDKDNITTEDDAQENASENEVKKRPEGINECLSDANINTYVDTKAFAESNESNVKISAEEIVAPEFAGVELGEQNMQDDTKESEPMECPNEEKQDAVQKSAEESGKSKGIDEITLGTELMNASDAQQESLKKSDTTEVVEIPDKDYPTNEDVIDDSVAKGEGEREERSDLKDEVSNTNAGSSGDQLIAAFETRKRMGSLSPGTIRRGNSPELGTERKESSSPQPEAARKEVSPLPVPKERKKKKKKNKKKGTVKLLVQELISKSTDSDGSGAEGTVDAESVDKPGDLHEDVDSHERKEDEGSIKEPELEEGETQGKEGAEEEVKGTKEESGSESKSSKDQSFDSQDDILLIEDSRPVAGDASSGKSDSVNLDVSSASEASDAEIGAKGKAKDKGKSKKDSKKDGCKSQ